MSEIKIIGSVYDPIRVTATVAAAVVGAPGMVWRGTYNAARYYYENEVVYWNGSSWIANRYVEEGLVPGVSASWSLVAQSGTSVPWADPEVYVPGNLLQVNAGSDGFEDAGVPAADVVKSEADLGNTSAGAIAKSYDDSGRKIIFDDGILVDNLISHISGESGKEHELPMFYAEYSDGFQPKIISSGKTIDNVKTELGYLYIPASAFEARKTNGATYTTEESTTYDQTRGCWLFNAATSQGIQIVIPNYGSGSLTTANFKYKLHTKIPVGGSEPTEPNNTVQWLVKAVFEKAVIDQEWGTAVGTKVTYDTNFNVSEESALVTAAGSLDTDTRMWIEINRYADDTENDLLAQDVAFLGIEIQFNLPTPS